MRLRLLTSLTPCLLLIAGCGQESTDEAKRCKKASPAAVSALSDGLRGQGELTKAVMVKSRDSAPLADLRKGGLYLVSGELEGKAFQVPRGFDVEGDVATWAVSGEFVKTGRGLVVGVENLAQRVSEGGARPAQRKLGPGFDIDGFSRSRRCVEDQGGS